MAGLRCAAILLQESYNVTIIEARNRIGGRVCDDQSAKVCAIIDVRADRSKRSDGTVGG